MKQFYYTFIIDEIINLYAIIYSMRSMSGINLFNMNSLNFLF